MAETSTSDGPAAGADFDMMSALDWKDGIATLPGSDIRFRMTEFGTLEIVTEVEPKVKEAELTGPQPQTTGTSNTHSSEQNKTLNQTAKPQSNTEHQTNAVVSTDPHRQAESNNAVESPSVSTVPNEIVPMTETTANCRSCGHSGSRESFLQGKYCSAPCVQPTSGRSTPAEAAEGERLGKRVRKKKKMFMESGDEEEDNIEEEEEKVRSSKGRRAAKVARLVTAPLVKKKTWSWSAYLEEERAITAPLKLFKEHQSFPQSRNGFKVGMKLEGLDPSHPAFFCVLTVAEVQGYRIRLHFDGYPECYDFWVNADSWDVKPPGWCEKTGLKLLLPKGIHFDGWSEEYDFWLDADSPDLHPVGWCQKTGHPLQHPNGPRDSPVPPGQGCPTPGCNGVGHIRGPRYGTHYTVVSCPYSDVNLNKDGLVPDRLNGERPVTLSGPPRHRRAEMLTQTHPPTPSASTPEAPDTTTDACPPARSVREHVVSGSAPKCVKPPQVKQEGDGKVY
ncbi:lethal(3)malignant brain tumor-like protein 3 [Sinocyclocheilus grahami]|uniref:lethal(3)malignant brain tumor-like protein 3 n=1 Tax=Sinocyclocheilus grahami TaxID=75366 RepID=UPI0007ACA2BA|nr:PREDICTED: lethal(3)malignant brain tumor-like protein 3 [Sinocyclocheilus grahami]